MGSWIDLIYNEFMFHGIETQVMEAIKQDPKLPNDNEGMKYIPIGQAILVENLIVSPTMTLPMDVSKTRNAYHAMVAVMKLVRHLGTSNGNGTVICPGFCTLVGCMDPKEAARQMAEAIYFFCHKNIIINDITSTRNL